MSLSFSFNLLYSEREEDKNMTHEEKYGNYYFDWEDYVPQDFDETEITEDKLTTISKEEMELLQKRKRELKANCARNETKIQALYSPPLLQNLFL